MSISAASHQGALQYIFFYFIFYFFVFLFWLHFNSHLYHHTNHTHYANMSIDQFFSTFFGRKLVLSSSTSFFISAIAGLTYRVKHPFTLTFIHTYGQFTVTNYTNSLLSFWTRGGSQYLLATINTPLGYMFPW